MARSFSSNGLRALCECFGHPPKCGSSAFEGVAGLGAFTELKRRDVLRVAAAYAVLSWLLIQVADTLGDTFGLPEWASKFVVMLLIIGLSFRGQTRFPRETRL